MGDRERAVATIREAIKLQTEVHGPDHADTVMMESNLASSPYAMGQREEAAGLFRSLLPRHREL
jgi:hypothetical protein